MRNSKFGKHNKIYTTTANSETVKKNKNRSNKKSNTTNSEMTKTVTGTNLNTTKREKIQ